jgi:hypothetical protein
MEEEGITGDEVIEEEMPEEVDAAPGVTILAQPSTRLGIPPSPGRR